MLTARARYLIRCAGVGAGTSIGSNANDFAPPKRQKRRRLRGQSVELFSNCARIQPRDMKTSHLDSFERLNYVSAGRETFARILSLLLALHVLLAVPILSFAQTNPTASPGSQQRATSAATQSQNPQDGVPLPQLVAQTEMSTRLRREIEQRLDRPGLDEIDPALSQLEPEIDRFKIELDETVAEDPRLAELSDLERDWTVRAQRYAKWQNELGERISLLEADHRSLDTQQAQWQATVTQIEGDPTLQGVLDRVRKQIADIQTIKGRVVAQRNEILVLQNKVSLQDQMVLEMVERIAEAKVQLRRRLVTRDSPPIWKMEFGGETTLEPAYGRALNRFVQFVKTRRSTIYLPIVVFVVTLLFAMALKRRLTDLAIEEIVNKEVRLLLSRPVSIAMVAGLLSALTLGPTPLMMRNLLALLLLVPMIRLFLPMIRPALHPLVYSLAAFAVASVAVEFFGPSAEARRFGAAALDAALLVVVIWLVRRSRAAGEDLIKMKGVLPFASSRIGILILIGSLLSNIFGYVALSHALRVGEFLSLNLAVILYMATKVTIGVVSILLQTRLVAKIDSVRLHKGTVLRWVSRAVETAAFLVWLYGSLAFFTIRSETLESARAALRAPLTAGTVSLSLGDVVAFLLTLFLGVTVARVVRALLQEDVLPEFSRDRGLPRAVSTLIYYALGIVVVVLALAAGGADFSRFTVLTGAFGLGVGFGLQTIIGNLASGVLLLIERPLNVGDVVEVAGVTGEVKRIGMSSTTVRTSQGAEVIVPNSNLITTQVINWTLSERKRRVDIPVGVSYGADPERVINLLIETAASQPEVVRDPAPVALFVGFGQSSLDFELQFWSPQASTYQQLKSDVALRIIAAFQEAGIEIPSQQTLQAKSLDSSINKSLAAPKQGPDIAAQH
jgi:potassium efflux system protein